MIACVVLRLRLCEEAGRCDCENREYSRLKCHFNFGLPCAVNFGWTSCSFLCQGTGAATRRSTADGMLRDQGVRIGQRHVALFDDIGDTFGCLRQETRFPLRATYPPSYYIICDPVSILPPWSVSSPTWIRFITAYRGSCKWCDGPRICSLPGGSKIFRFHWLCKLELIHIYRLRCFPLRN